MTQREHQSKHHHFLSPTQRYKIVELMFFYPRFDFAFIPAHLL